MPATVWILKPTHRDGPYLLLRAGVITRVEQNDHDRVIVHDTGGDKHFAAQGSTDLELPTDFGIQLLQALEAARRTAQDVDRDRVVTARRGDNGWSWLTYALDEVPPAQGEPFLPASVDAAAELAAAGPASWSNGSFVPNPKGPDQGQAEADGVTE